MTKQELANKLIEAIGDDFAQLLGEVNNQATTIARKHIAALCERTGITLSNTDAASVVAGALAGLLVGPAVGYAVSAGATTEQYIELVRSLFADAQAEDSEPN